LRTVSEFPAWFVNIVDFLAPQGRDLQLELRGYASAPSTGTLDWTVGQDMVVEGQRAVGLDRGVHPVVVQASLRGEQWRLEPTWNGDNAWDHVKFTQGEPSAMQAMAPALRWLTAGTVVTLIIVWGAIAFAPYARMPWVLAWCAAASLSMVALAMSDSTARFAPLVLVVGAVIPVTTRMRRLRTAFVLVGMPWLVYFATRAWPQIGHFTSYSADDWLTYQVAGYRIFMHGFWLEGGTAVFDYQPLYRWLSGALHVIFGDSSVGELLLDGASLLGGALLAFHLVRSRAGFRPALVAAVATLATFTIGTPWYFLGRGLSEVAAAGWAFLAVFALLRAKTGRLGWSVAAGVFATLMFYTRLNHLLFAPFMLAALLPMRAPARWHAISTALIRVRLRAAAVFALTFSAGVFAFMARTWWYTGAFSLFHGTSLRHNDTGLRPWTLLDGDVWGRVAHSVAGLVFMNEPPSPDLRAGLVTLGAIVAVLALLQFPVARQQSLMVVLLVIGASVGALFAHAHHYPGRFSIHLVPLAVALSMTTIASVVDGR
jgi:hypothetical protein